MTVTVISTKNIVIFGVLQRVWRESIHYDGTDIEENESYREVSTVAISSMASSSRGKH